MKWRNKTSQIKLVLFKNTVHVLHFLFFRNDKFRNSNDKRIVIRYRNSDDPFFLVPSFLHKFSVANFRGFFFFFFFFSIMLNPYFGIWLKLLLPLLSGGSTWRSSWRCRQWSGYGSVTQVWSRNRDSKHSRRTMHHWRGNSGSASRWRIWHLLRRNRWSRSHKQCQNCSQNLVLRDLLIIAI